MSGSSTLLASLRNRARAQIRNLERCCLKNRDKDMELLLAKLLHEYAYELDANYEIDRMAMLAAEDDSFRVFRRALQELRKRKVKVSDRVLHVQRRMEDAYGDAFHEELPKLLAED
jgi:hypothetical protein